MKRFNENWPDTDDNIKLWLDVKTMPMSETEWPNLQYTKDLTAKMYEDEDIPATEIAFLRNCRHTTRATRRKATTKAKQHRAKIVVIRKAKARRTWSDVCRHPWEFYGKNIDRLMGEVVVR